MPTKRPKFVLVREPDAGGRVREIFEEAKEKLGLPLVPLLYKAYAAYPEFLELHWRAFKPFVERQQFWDLAERLRADAYTRMHNYFRVPNLCEQVEDASLSVGARHELTELVELLQVANPPALLLAAAQLEAFDHKLGWAATSEKSSEKAQPRPQHQRPVVVEEEIARAPTKKIYADMKRVLELPVLNVDYRALARFPDFLAAYWNALKPLAQSPVYGECRESVSYFAIKLAKEPPVPIELTVEQLQDSEVKDDDVAAIVRITQELVQMLSGLVLNMAVAKIGLEGGNGNAQKEHPEPIQAA
jgi:hypothetical protein